MFIELTRVYVNSPYEHKMILAIPPILKVEPVPVHEDKPGNTRIVLDRIGTDGENVVMYFRDTYQSVALRIKQLYNPPARTRKKKVLL